MNYISSMNFAATIETTNNEASTMTTASNTVAWINCMTFAQISTIVNLIMDGTRLKAIREIRRSFDVDCGYHVAVDIYKNIY